MAAHCWRLIPGSGWLGGRGVARRGQRGSRQRRAGSAACTWNERSRKPSHRLVRAELLLALGESQLHAGAGGRNPAHAAGAQLSADPGGAPRLRALGRALFSAGDWPGAADAFRRGLGELAGRDDDCHLSCAAGTSRSGANGAAPGGNAVPAAGAERLRARPEMTRRPHRMERLQPSTRTPIWRSGARPHGEVARLARRVVADGALLHDSATTPGRTPPPATAVVCR